MEEEQLAKFLHEVVSGVQPLDSFVAYLAGVAELASFDQKWQCFGDTAVLASLPRLADWMLKRAGSVDALTVVCDLERYLRTDEIPVREIMVVASVTVEKPITLGRDTTVTAFEDIPSSVWKESLASHFGSSWLSYRPAVAIQRRTNYLRDHRDSPPEAKQQNGVPFQILEDVRLCMTATSRSAPLWLGSWAQAEEWVPNLVNSAMLAEPLNVGAYAARIDEDWNELADVHARWTQLKDAEKSRLRVPLTRINSARRHPDVVNAAIDLGIAIDSVFLAEDGFGPVRLRAARFLREAKEERREIAKTFAALWKLRCDAVHTGRIRSDGDAEATRKAIHEGCWLVSEAIKRWIRHGQPDWDDLFFR